MKSPGSNIYRRLSVLLIAMIVLFLSLDQGLASGVRQEPYPGFTPLPTFDPYPGVTLPPTENPYPGADPTQPSVASTPTQASPTGIPSQVPSRTPTVQNVIPQQITETAEFLPLPTFELLFPGSLPQETETPEVASVARAAIELEAESRPSTRLISVLGVLVVVIWGLLGLFLVIFLKRVGY